MAPNDWQIEGLTRHHRGAWPLILDLYEEGWASRAGVEAVRQRLDELGQSQSALDEAAEAGVEAGFLDADALDAWLD